MKSDQYCIAEAKRHLEVAKSYIARISIDNPTITKNEKDVLRDTINYVQSVIDALGDPDAMEVLL